MRRFLTSLLAAWFAVTPAWATVDFPSSPSTGQTYSNEGRVWTYNGTGWIISGGAQPNIAIQVFGADGTYTPSAGMRQAQVIATGGGGGGGGSDTDGTGAAGASGGQAGGTAIKTYTAEQIGASAAITIGAGGTPGSATSGTNGGDGGTTTFDPAGTGDSLVCDGGDLGDGQNSTTDNSTAIGGEGEGACTGGDLNIIGGDGFRGTSGPADAVSNPPFAIGGQGGASYWGGGGRGGSLATTGDSAGQNGDALGSGGAGGASVDSTTGAAGGTGGSGVVYIVEYIGDTWGVAQTLFSGDAGANGPTLSFLHDSASPALNDYPAQIIVRGGADDDFLGSLSLKLIDGTSASEDSQWEFYVADTGLPEISLALGVPVATPNVGQWNIDQNGNLIPGVDIGNDIGNSASGVKSFYLGTSGTAMQDYEEGSWTPVFSFNSSTSGVTYVVQLGRYVRAGDLVCISANIELSSNGTGVGNASIAGLPYTAKNGDGFDTEVIFDMTGGSGTAGSIHGAIADNASTITPRQSGTGSSTTLTDTNIGNTSVTRMGGCYSAQ